MSQTIFIRSDKLYYRLIYTENGPTLVLTDDKSRNIITKNLIRSTKMRALMCRFFPVL